MKVFLSYTAKDLLEHADAAARVVRRMEHVAIDHREWVASGFPSVDECRERVRECDVLVVLVAHRYGWVPSEEQRGDGERSITWLEVDEARRAGLQVLPFVVDEDSVWPVKQIEGLHDPLVLDRLERFKEVLRSSVCSFFSTPQSLEAALGPALHSAQQRVGRAPAGMEADRHSSPDDVTAYLKHLEQSLRRVSLLGFGEQFQVTLPIDELYVPLRASVPRSFMSAGDDEAAVRKAPKHADHLESDVALSDAFRKADELDLRGVVLLGDPGSGKTTAARQIAWQCADAIQGPASLGLAPGAVPVLLRLRKLRSTQDGLDALLRQEVSSIKLSDGANLGDCLLGCDALVWILDGLDEVADAKLRGKVSTWIRAAIEQRPNDRFVVTSRYAGYEGDALLGPGFLDMRVQQLDEEQQREFVTRWYRTVERSVRGAHAEAFAIAAQRTAELTAVLAGPDFRARRLASMVANPLLLSILCVVHRKDLDLPRRRADLYDKCLDVFLESWRHEWRKSWGRDSFDAGVARLVLQPIA